jgi:hypothetical protein
MINAVQSACCTNRCVLVNVSDYIPLALSINKHQCLGSVGLCYTMSIRISARE